MNPLACLFNPESIAIVGASTDDSKTTGRPIAYLRKHGYAGAVYPVNPKVAAIGALPCYASIDDLPAVPDVGLILLRPELAIRAVRDLAAKGAKAAVVLAGGFQEIGTQDGAQRQAELKAAAGGMLLLGPNTIGLVNVTQRVTLSASAALEVDNLQSGSVALVSQSGGILGSLLSRAVAQGIGFSKLVSTGNECDIDVSDCIEYLLDDPATKAIAVYLEGLRNPARFRAVCEAARAAGKPVVVFKVGRSEAGARSAASHTGALAGEDRIYSALFKQVGALRADNFSDLLDLSSALATGQRLLGKSIAILTSTGGAGTLVADSCGLAGFLTPPPDPETAQHLNALQTDSQVVLDRNPIDLTLEGLKPAVLQGAISGLLQSHLYDGLVVVAGSSSLHRPDLVLDAIEQSRNDSTKPILVYVSPHAPDLVRRLNRLGVPAFVNPESCARAFSALLPQASRKTDIRARPASRRTSGSNYAAAHGALNEHDSKALFAEFGVRPVSEIVFEKAEDAGPAVSAIGERAVLKVLSRDLLHKSEHGGVRVGVSAGEAGKICAEMKVRVQQGAQVVPEGYLAQEMVTGAIEVILGYYKDPQLGPVILFGMGGVMAEIIQDSSVRVLPIGPADASAMIRELKMWPLLDGYRGQPRRDIAAIEDAILNFADMVAQLGQTLLEAEINPLFVLKEGEGVKAGDGLAVFQ